MVCRMQSLRSALLDLAEEYASRADRLERLAVAGFRTPQADPVMEARRLRQIAEHAKGVAEGLRF